jgi:hypothetical protein
MSTDQRLRRLELNQSHEPRGMHELSDKELCAIIMEGTEVTERAEVTEEMLLRIIAEGGRERGR